MPPRPRAIALGINSKSLVYSIALVALLLPSCSESKVSQCQKLLHITDSLEPLNREFQAEMKKPKNSRPKDISEVKSMLNQTSTIFQKTANKFIEIGQEARSLNLSDERIDKLKTRYIDLIERYQVSLTKLSNLLLDTVQINKVSEFSGKFQKLERDGATLFQQLPKLDTEKQKLEQEVRLYCRTG